MIVFPVIGALLIVVALAFILPPLRKRDRGRAATTVADANVSVYRRQLAEMESDCRHGLMSNEQFLRDREELEQRLVADVPKESRASRRGGTAVSSDALMYGLAVGLPLAAILLYLTLGTPSSLSQLP